MCRSVGLSQPPVSLLGSKKEPLFFIPVIPGLGLIIGTFGFISARFLTFLRNSSFDSSGQPKGYTRLKGSRMLGISAVPRVSKG